MEGQAKLTRTNSSLLRSSPTIRSSIHSLSSVNEEDVILNVQDEEEVKGKKKPHRPGSSLYMCFVHRPHKALHVFSSSSLFLFPFSAATVAAKGDGGNRRPLSLSSTPSSHSLLTSVASLHLPAAMNGDGDELLRFRQAATELERRQRRGSFSGDG